MAGICSRCGLPSGIGRGNVWHSNGVITASYPPHIRGTLYDVEELNHLFPTISERIGFDITRLVVEGKRKDGKRYTDALIRNLEATGNKLTPLEIYKLIARFCRYWGLGMSEVIDYREGETLSLRVSRYYSDPMSRGDWAGVFEAVEKKRGEANWKEGAEGEVVEVVAVEGEPELEERIEQEVELGIPCEDEGDLQYQHCPECSVPLEISRQFSWTRIRPMSWKRYPASASSSTTPMGSWPWCACCARSWGRISMALSSTFPAITPGNTTHRWGRRPPWTRSS